MQENQEETNSEQRELADIGIRRIQPSVVEPLHILLNKGVTKWVISKRVGVTWRTVRYWEQGFSEPKEFNMKALWDLVDEVNEAGG